MHKIDGKYRAKEVMDKTGFHRRRLKLWEEYGLLNPKRAENNDRLYTADDIEMIRWAAKLMDKGLSAEAIKILIEYFRTGKIVSYKWYKNT